MKRSPVKGKLSNFFSNLGNQLKRNRKDIGGEMKKKYSGKAQRADEVPRPGESKYQFDVRTKKARSRKPKVGEFTTKQKLEGNLVPNQELMNTKVKKSKPKVKTKVKTKPKNNDGPRVNKVKKKKINTKTIKQDIAPTPGPLDPKYMPKTGDKELTLEDFKRITKPRNKSAGGLQSTYIGKPIIDPLIKQSMKLSGKGLNNFFEGEPEPEIRSGIRKKSPSKKKGYKMKRKK